MKINHFNKTIELTKAEANKAGKYGTEAYEQLIEVQHNFPEYRLEIVKAKVNLWFNVLLGRCKRR